MIRARVLRPTSVGNKKIGPAREKDGICLFLPLQKIKARVRDTKRTKAKAPSAVEDETRTTQMGLNHEPRHRNKLETY